MWPVRDYCVYRGTSLTRNRLLPGAYSSPVPRSLGWSLGEAQFLTGEGFLYGEDGSIDNDVIVLPPNKVYALGAYVRSSGRTEGSRHHAATGRASHLACHLRCGIWCLGERTRPLSPFPESNQNIASKGSVQGNRTFFDAKSGPCTDLRGYLADQKQPLPPGPPQDPKQSYCTGLGRGGVL